MSTSKLSHESIGKIRDVLASILSSAVKYGLLIKNPCEAAHLPPLPRGRRRQKPFIYRHQSDAMLELIQEPYASMVYVAIFTGLRVSELVALKWGNVHSDAITIDERFCAPAVTRRTDKTCLAYNYAARLRYCNEPTFTGASYAQVYGVISGCNSRNDPSGTAETKIWHS